MQFQSSKNQSSPVPIAIGNYRDKKRTVSSTNQLKSRNYEH
jgi:hypothetical protein